MQSFTIEEFKKIHQAWEESGLSVRDYCANTGIKESHGGCRNIQAAHPLLCQYWYQGKPFLLLEETY